METFRYNSRNNKLEQGKWYKFILQKLVTLGDGNTYMVLEDPFSIRHFIEYLPYQVYNLSLNEEINCLVEKINCTGRVILEPKHPIYKIGEVYEFPIISVESKPNGYRTILKDALGKNFEYLTALPLKGNSLKARVIKITKGLPEIV